MGFGGGRWTSAAHKRRAACPRYGRFIWVATMHVIVGQAGNIGRGFQDPPPRRPAPRVSGQITDQSLCEFLLMKQVRSSAPSGIQDAGDRKCSWPGASEGERVPWPVVVPVWPCSLLGRCCTGAAAKRRPKSNT